MNEDCGMKQNTRYVCVCVYAHASVHACVSIKKEGRVFDKVEMET